MIKLHLAKQYMYMHDNIKSRQVEFENTKGIVTVRHLNRFFSGRNIENCSTRLGSALATSFRAALVRLNI